MMSIEPHFVWADLSAPEVDPAVAFYEDVLDWYFEDADGYFYGHAGGEPVIGLYRTPDKFQAMGMPSFWMSYIAVPSVADTVAKAKAIGGIVELEADTYALIRDPLGAGFTVTQDMGGAAEASNAPGRRAAHGLYCSEIAAILPFYEALFGWRFEAKDGWSDIMAGNDCVARVVEAPDEERGKFQYWAVYFSVTDLGDVTKAAAAAGGETGGVHDTPEGPAALIYDPNGAAFFAVERGPWG